MAAIPLVGPTYTSRSVAADCQRTINWFVEAVESGAGKAPAVLYPTPGLRSLGRAGVGTGWRGIWRTATNQVFGVVGQWLVEVTEASGQPGVFVVVTRGVVPDDGRPVTLADNGIRGGQLAIVSGGVLSLYTIATAALTVPTLAISPVVAVTYLDAYFVAIGPTSIQISGLDDGSTWDAADVAGRNEAADPLQTGIQNHRELWLLGDVTSEVWYNSGGADFPFIPIPGVFIEVGIAAPASLCRYDQTVAWLGKTRDGDRLALVAEQYVPKRVSTHAIEQAWCRYARTDDAVSWTYQDDGHQFWVITFPTANATWVYDRATQLWHERAHWDVAVGLWEAHRGACHTFAWGRHLVGDRASDVLYALDHRTLLDELPEGFAAIRRLRRLPHLSQENQLLQHGCVELELEAGLGRATGQGVSPMAMLRWSDDRAHTWSAEWWESASPMGTYGAQVQWQRLGQSRDRVYEVSVSDPIPWRLIAAYLTARKGRS